MIPEGYTRSSTTSGGKLTVEYRYPLTPQAIIVVVKKKRLLNDVNPSATPGVREHNLLFIDSGEIFVVFL